MWETEERKKNIYWPNKKQNGQSTQCGGSVCYYFPYKQWKHELLNAAVCITAVHLVNHPRQPRQSYNHTFYEFNKKTKIKMENMEICNIRIFIYTYWKDYGGSSFHFFFFFHATPKKYLKKRKLYANRHKNKRMHWILFVWLCSRFFIFFYCCSVDPNTWLAFFGREKWKNLGLIAAQPNENTNNSKKKNKKFQNAQRT